MASLGGDEERQVSDAAEVTEERFRAVLGRFATGVMVLTTAHDGAPHGMTVNAVSSLSLDPLLVLVCIERGTVMERLVETSGRFALSILPYEDQRLSVHFADADRPMGAAQFGTVATGTAVTGAPVLEDSLGWIDCEVWADYDGGDHRIVVGRVVGLGLGPEAEPLVYYRSDYHTLHGEGSSSER